MPARIFKIEGEAETKEEIFLEPSISLKIQNKGSNPISLLFVTTTPTYNTNIYQMKPFSKEDFFMTTDRIKIVFDKFSIVQILEEIA